MHGTKISEKIRDKQQAQQDREARRCDVWLDIDFEYAKLKQKVTKKKNGCWLLVPNSSSGYVRHRVLGYAHRLAYAYHYRVLPPDGRRFHVCHTCDTPNCINPSHLFLGTAKDNHEDAVRKGRKRHDPHLYLRGDQSTK